MCNVYYCMIVILDMVKLEERFFLVFGISDIVWIENIRLVFNYKG